MNYADINLPSVLSEANIEWKNGAGGWVQLRCPMCGDSGFHLGWHGRGFYCWRCGSLSAKDVFDALGISYRTLAASARAGGYSAPGAQTGVRPNTAPATTNKRRLPTYPLQTPHKRYLKSRNFDPKMLASVWGIKATTFIAPRPWRWRIIIPYASGAYQGRALGNTEPRYMSSGPEVKMELYGDWLAIGSSVVVVEGPTKVWRLGPGAVATAGVGATPAQIMNLRNWRRVVILADGDKVGRRGAEKTAEQVASIWNDVDVTLVIPDFEDIGNAPQRYASKLMASLLSGG